jgi:hypothetical protein
MILHFIQCDMIFNSRGEGG